MVVDDYPLTHPGTPEGGIFLHWIVTVVYICVTAGFDRVADAIAFSGNLLVYGHFFVEGKCNDLLAFCYLSLTIFLGLVGLGFIWFNPYLRTIRDPAYPAINWYRDETDHHPAHWMRPTSNTSYDHNASRQNPLVRQLFWLLRGRGQTLIGTVIFAFSIVIVVAEMYSSPGRAYFSVILVTTGTAWIYWFLFVRCGTARKVYRFFGYEFEEQTHGVDDVDDPSRLCAWCLSLHMGHRHPHEGYGSYNKVTVRSSIKFPLVSYTLLGDRTRDQNTIRSWSDVMRYRNWFPGRGGSVPSGGYPLDDVRRRAATEHE
jgi:hypothetical protein